MSPNDWDTSLSKGEKWVPRVAKSATEFIIENGLKKQSIRIIPFDTYENKKTQLSGIDVICKPLGISLEIKTRYDTRWYNKDILLETVSIIETGKKGWLYTSKADFLAYIWVNKDPLPIGYIIDLPVLRKSRIMKRLNSFKERKACSHSGNSRWSTLNREVPIYKFPEKTIYQFNPNKVRNKETKLG